MDEMLGKHRGELEANPSSEFEAIFSGEQEVRFLIDGGKGDVNEVRVSEMTQQQ